MTVIGTPCSANAKKILLLGSGELGKEVVIECQRLGCEVLACDSYDNAPAMQVAHRRHVFSMLDGAALRRVVEQEKPDLIVPEVEAIATEVLVELEDSGYTVVPGAKAASTTMNREKIRRLAAETLSLPTSNFLFADTYDIFCAAVNSIGYPCFVKPIMSSSGKGQSRLSSPDQLPEAWQYAQHGGRAGGGKVIIESAVDFDFEITLLTVRSRQGTRFCAPIGHTQEGGDYRQSWQPQPVSQQAMANAERIAATITEALGGYGIFGVELFVKGDDVIFSEVSPRPHDTGMVTLISQNLSEFALHVRAMLGLPIPLITCDSPCASAVVLAQGKGSNIQYTNLSEALMQPHTELRLFGKPQVDGIRRMGVALAKGLTLEEARRKAQAVVDNITIHVN